MKKNFKINARHEAIRALIDQTPVENQQDLVNLLKQDYNIDANQAVISRDLHELGVTKKLVNGRLIYENSKVDVTKEILTRSINDVVYNEAMIIVKTIPGLADFVGDYLDSQDNAGILGTIAGENVVFITPWSVQNIELTFERICMLLGFKAHAHHKREL